jgi:hypothetical protein
MNRNSVLKMRIRNSKLVLLAMLLALPVWAQTAQPQGNPAKSKSLDELGLQVRDQQQSTAHAGGGARATQATPEKIISPEEAQELFKSVDEILEFASRETKLPIKEEVKRRLVERSEVQSFI